MRRRCDIGGFEHDSGGAALDEHGPSNAASVTVGRTSSAFDRSTKTGALIESEHEEAHSFGVVGRGGCTDPRGSGPREPGYSTFGRGFLRDVTFVTPTGPKPSSETLTSYMQQLGT